MSQTNINILMDDNLKQQSFDIPNTETLAAIDDVNHKRNLSKPFHSISELMEDLNDWYKNFNINENRTHSDLFWLIFKPFGAFYL